MKKQLVLLTLLLCCFLPNSGIACCNLDCIENKEYISSEQIIFNQEGIFVLFDNIPEAVSLIAQDPSGIYCVRTTWKCQHCGYVNPWYKTKCGNCRR